MRKFIIVSVIALGLAGHSFGQEFLRMTFTQPAALIASAGHDTLVCLNHSVLLGGNPTATGGYNNYVYLWSPPDGLDDPTSPNPTATLSESISYTLTVTDINGCQAVSTVTVNIDACLGISEQDLIRALTVFPNPSNGVFRIGGLSNYQGQLQKVEIVNYLGQNIFSRNYSDGEPFPEQGLDTNIKDPGLYVVRITLADRMVSKRLIIR